MKHLRVRFTMIEMLVAIFMMLIEVCVLSFFLFLCHACYTTVNTHSRTGKSYTRMLGEGFKSIKEEFQKGYEDKEVQE